MPYPRRHLSRLALWRHATFLLLLFLIFSLPGQAQNGTCPIGTPTSPIFYFNFTGTGSGANLQNLGQGLFNNTQIWAYPANLSPTSDWYTTIKWKYDDNDGSFRGLYDNASTDEPKLPLFNADLTTYIGNQGNQNVTYTGYLPLGPNETWCAQPAADIDGAVDDGGNLYIEVKTAPAFPPTNLAVNNNGIGFTRVEITWGKGTHAPDTRHQYIVVAKETNGGQEVQRDTVPGTSRQHTFRGLTDGTQYTFEVQTYIKADALNYLSGLTNWNYNSYNASTSSAVSTNATTQNFSFNISQGAFPTKVRLTWSSISGSEGSSIRVQRNVVAPRSTSTPNLNNFEERAILGTASTSYEDLDAIPGLVYKYRLTVLDASNNAISAFEATGWRRPNGVIRGRIQTSNNTGVGGVRICAKPKNPIQVVGAAGVMPPPDSGYCVNSTVSGRFEIRNIYYFDSATYVITPYLKDHSFDPGLDEAILDVSTPVQSGFVFVDTTAYGLGGKVYFPLASTFGAQGTDTIPVAGATILVDTTDFGIRTDSEGNWSYAVLDTGTYTFRPQFLDHTFDKSVLTVSIDRDRNDLNFVDQKVDSVRIRTQDGCGDPVVDSVLVNVSYDVPGGNSFFDTTVATSSQGLAMLTLPASRFKFAVTANNPALDAASTDPNIKPQFLSSPISLDLSFRDSVRAVRRDSIFVTRPDSTVTLPDTSFVIPGGRFFQGVQVDSIWRKPQPSADFLYYGPIKVSVNWEETGAEIVRNCKVTGPATADDSVIVVQSGATYRLTISIIDSIKNCPVDTGKITIFDYVSDRERSPISLPISKGKVTYTMEAGDPNTANGGTYPYQKPFFLSVEAGSRDAEAKANWVLVEGAEDITPTFTTRSPELPDLVVHDPPGDASYAWIEKGSSRSILQTVQFQAEENGSGVWVDATIGFSKESEVPGTPGAIKGGIILETERETGKEASFTKAYGYTYEFTENFSTSAEPFWTGYDGDVYIGKATNQRFSIAKVLLFDRSSCIAGIQDKPNLELTGIATTFHYTEKHIKRILLPQLEFLEKTLRREASRATDQDRKNELLSQADSFMVDQVNWKGILAKNAKNRDSLATFKENISFSAGAPYERVVTTTMDTVVEQEYFEYRDQSFNVGAAFELEYYVWFEAHGGKYGSSRIVTMPNNNDARALNKDSTLSGTLSMGYAFDDVNFGDYFSVDVLEDPNGIPAFRTFAGASSCPHELGTQARDKGQITVFPPRIDNADPEEGATFSVTLTNKSESRETRDYYVRAHPQSNPHGAVITLGGFEIMTDQMQFTLDSLSVELPLVIEKGPRSSNYENIAISIVPQCEWDLFQNNGDVTGGDTIFVSVSFETECSSVAIVEPGNNWAINAQTGNTLVVDLGGYDTNNENLESLTLQYRFQGEDWVDAQTVLVGDLVDDLYRMSIDFENLPNGRYWLRARANCNSGGDLVYSPEIPGIVEKGSVAPFGVPSPNDGFLRKGQELYVKFDQPMDTAINNRSNYPSPPTLKLVRSDDLSEVPYEVRWSLDSTRIYLDIEPSYLANPDVDGKEVQITVAGLRSGLTPNFESQTAGLDWKLLLNTSPVTWDPGLIKAKAFKGESTVFEAKLQSATGTPKDFLITRHPSWLIVSDSSGAVLPYNSQAVAFASNPETGVGTYRDTVLASIDGIAEQLIVELEVSARNPNWTVNPGNYQFTMSTVAAFCLDNTNTNLSRDSLDLVAAVVDGDVRGVSPLQYVPEVDKYLAFLTIHSNAQFGEQVSFRMFRKRTGDIFGAQETLTFAADQVQGRIQRPFYLHPNGTFQRIPLTQGWNWVSFNRDAANWSRETVLGSLLSPFRNQTITVLNKSGNMSSYQKANPPYQYLNFWSGNLTTLNNREMFMVYLSDSPDTLMLLGDPITSPVNVPIANGWNWIGYPSSQPRPINEAMAGYVARPRNYDLIKSQDAFAEFHNPANKWIGQLRMMTPGEGYRFNARNPRGNAILFPLREGLEAYEVVDHHQYEQQMPFIGTISFAGEGPKHLDRLMVGAFMGDTCRGAGYLEYIEKLGEYRVLFGIHGNMQDFGRELTFKVWDVMAEEEYTVDNLPVQWLGGQFLGQPDAPYELFRDFSLSEGGYRLEQNNPNPYDNRTSISYTLPRKEQVKITVYDHLGKVVAVLVDEEKAAGSHVLTFDAQDIPAGVYVYSLQAGTFRTSRKMVKF
jgi:hypothetical protein